MPDMTQKHTAATQLDAPISALRVRVRVRVIGVQYYAPGPWPLASPHHPPGRHCPVLPPQDVQTEHGVEQHHRHCRRRRRRRRRWLPPSVKKKQWLVKHAQTGPRCVVVTGVSLGGGFFL